MVFRVEEMFKARVNELFARKVHHDPLVIESFGANSLGAQLGIFYVAKIDQALAFDAIEQYLLHVILTVGLEIL